jgi:preprotein translocase subunit SecF
MSVLRRLYRGETNIDFVGYRKRWYIASAVIILICLLSIVFRGFNFGVEFAGGNKFLVPANQSGVVLQDVRGAAESTGVEVSSAQVRGSGQTRQYEIRTPKLSDEQRTNLVAAVADAARVEQKDVNTSEVSSSWGRAVTKQALIGLVVFLLVVSAYIWIRFEQRMAIAAIGALVHDLVLTAGVYSLIGFEVTPGTVIGLLTILGFSLYDTVVVFDKVEENARGLLGQTRMTYGEAANLAVNQTLMRSINTSLIGLLPVAGLLFVGAGLLGVGTLKDLALVLFVGMLTGAYSSLFLATPWLVDLKLLDQRYRLHQQRVMSRRVATEAKVGEAAPAGRTRVVAKAGAGKAAPATRAAVGKAAGAKVAATKPAKAAAGAKAAGKAAAAGKPATGKATGGRATEDGTTPGKATRSGRAQRAGRGDEIEPTEAEFEEPAEVGPEPADDIQTRIDTLAGGTAPRVGAKPPQRKRQGGKRR